MSDKCLVGLAWLFPWIYPLFSVHFLCIPWLYKVIKWCHNISIVQKSCTACFSLSFLFCVIAMLLFSQKAFTVTTQQMFTWRTFMVLWANIIHVYGFEKTTWTRWVGLWNSFPNRNPIRWSVFPTLWLCNLWVSTMTGTILLK